MALEPWAPIMERVSSPLKEKNQGLLQSCGSCCSPSKSGRTMAMTAKGSLHWRGFLVLRSNARQAVWLLSSWKTHAAGLERHILIQKGNGTGRENSAMATGESRRKEEGGLHSCQWDCCSKERRHSPRLQSESSNQALGWILANKHPLGVRVQQLALYLESSSGSFGNEMESVGDVEWLS